MFNKKIKLTLEYDGSAFSGWQNQIGSKTIQGELERAVSLYANSRAKQLGLLETYYISITGSGRTDAGVHAVEQVASFVVPKILEFDSYKLQAALNGIVEGPISIKKIEFVDDDFDARFSPHIKRYQYRLFQSKTPPQIFAKNHWWVRQELDCALMIQAAKIFIGTHNFSGFRASDCVAKTTVRTISMSEFVRISDNQFIYIVEGNGFLKQMIRILIGSIVAVGTGEFDLDHLCGVLKTGDRRLAGRTAPAHGLTLERVRYFC